MMKKIVFYRCKHCGNVAIKLVDSKVPMFCCGEPMEVINAGHTDGAFEKHLPVVKIDNDNVLVEVGELLHPMTAEHYIQFIVLETENRYQVVNLQPNCQPIANFKLANNEKIVAVYAYCNLHSLWSKEFNN